MNKSLDTDYQQFIYLSAYSRWLWDKNRRESWDETVTRYFDFMEKHLKKQCDYTLTPKLRARLEKHVLTLDGMPSMRALSSAGKALERDNIAAYNCAYLPIDNPKAFDELMYILLCSTGVGFSIEESYINKMPFVPDKLYPTDTIIKVHDSKLGWAKAYRELIAMLYAGHIPGWDTSKVRAAGTPLKIFGGRASGPEPLIELFEFTIKVFQRAVGRRLSTIDCHDMACMVGSVVVSGGVKRAACISFSDLSDDSMRSAKSGQWWLENPQRALSNNSAVYKNRPDIGTFMKEWKSLYDSKSGERGFFNVKGAMDHIKKNGRREPREDMRLNPCITGDTKIAVADGRNGITIKQLVDNNEDNIPVYCSDNNGNLVIRNMVHPRITGYNVPIYKVNLDNGKSLRVTGNHKFKLRDGSYQEARSLKSGDSLNVLNKYIPDGRSESRGDQYISLGYCGTTYFEHRMIQKNNCGKIPDGYHVNHLDHNKLNNNIDNLECLSEFDHLSKHGTLENNGRWLGISDDKMFEHGILLCKKFERRFSNKEWLHYAKEHKLPQHITNNRQKTLGTPFEFSKKCAQLCGIKDDLVDVDTRISRLYIKLVNSGFDVFIDNKEIYINKVCEICSKPFIRNIHSREISVCSHVCGYKMRDPVSIKTQYENQKSTLENIKVDRRNQQAQVYSDLKFKLNRNPEKNEWITGCKENNYKFRLGPISPFRNYNSVKEYASEYNHKVISVEKDGFEDVYNGTVDEFHNFFIGEFSEKTPKGRPKYCYINNLQCGEILLRPKQFCNLVEVVARYDDTLETLSAKVENATILGTFQSTLTNFKYISRDWKKNCEEERLLGVSITGICDSPLLAPNKLNMTEDEEKKLKNILSELKNVTIETNKELAMQLGINHSTATTTIKPSGCTTLDTKVRTSEGVKSLSEIFYINDVKPSEMFPDNWIKPKKDIFVYDENNDKQKITQLYVNDITTDVYEIEDENGKTFKFTGNHKLKTVKNVYKRIDELTVEDEILSFTKEKAKNSENKNN